MLVTLSKSTYFSSEDVVLLYLVVCLGFSAVVQRGFKLAFFGGAFPLGILADSWSIMFMLLLFYISSSVYVWSFYYMDTDPTYRRFLGLLCSFVGAMMLLVVSSTLYAAIVGWDGLGVTSFLLVIYFKNRKSLAGGLVTALTNRVGDAVFLVLLGVSLGHSGVLSHWQVVCVLVLAMTKSAQYPFSSWLPAAMAAPTPVSALVHSSTLVTAGVYVMLRYNAHDFQWMLVAGSVTMLMAGLCACAEMDLKKIVALSTLSQLGVMVVALGMGLKHFCFFHLMTHALFKALLFLCVGVFIHHRFGGQELRSFTVLGSSARSASVFASLACFALLGFPFLAGFYSKDLIVEGAYSRGLGYQALVWFLVGIGLTTAYSLKMISLSLFSSGSASAAATASAAVGAAVSTPLLALGSGAAWGGIFLVCEAGPAIVLGVDKALPLLFVGAGVLLSSVVGGLRVSFFSSMWGLTPCVQRGSGCSRAWRGATAVELGTAHICGGSGALTAVGVARYSAAAWISAALAVFVAAM